VPYPFNTKNLLKFQLAGSLSLITTAVDAATDDEWTSRAFPSANLIGFTPWHAARTIDWAINHVLREQEELADAPEWSDLKVEDGWFGAGVTREVADRVPGAVSRQRLRAYVAALKADSLAWLDEVPLEELDGVTNLRRSRVAKPEYETDAVRAEIADLDGIPKWQFLARPCMSHIRVHHGQTMTELQALRAR
jgi:hypothetical protein